MPLTERQAKFVDHYALCGNATEAARLAGYSAKTARQIAAENLSKPVVLAAVEAKRAGFAQELKITKNEVVVGVVGAIDIAREQRNPAAMIAGLVQLAKLCGFYQPETIKLELSEEACRMQNKFSAMSDEELFAIAARTGGANTAY